MKMKIRVKMILVPKTLSKYRPIRVPMATAKTIVIPICVIRDKYFQTVCLAKSNTLAFYVRPTTNRAPRT